ncbi:hypothetical protein SAMN05216167_1464 [Spirosoma endophyticum]|uniref:Uncharacterized protein n=1 Tax=Spirosoma endophyticum TaxID=662367 RepID=A0A1I2HM04_9BACT|nr:hypothetical protein SAMN05216167_1464 [Spirosoma endophyticum]
MGSLRRCGTKWQSDPPIEIGLVKAFFEHILKDLFVQAQDGHYLFQLAILFLSDRPSQLCQVPLYVLYLCPLPLPTVYEIGKAPHPRNQTPGSRLVQPADWQS